MTTINNGESGLSVRNKINEIINKVEGVTAINNSIDVTGTVTADGLTVDNGGGTFTGLLPTIDLMESDTTNLNTRLQNQVGDFSIRTLSDNKVTITNRFLIDHATGDISFYEDTGTTPKFFWDASAEALGIGTTTPITYGQVASVVSTSKGAFAAHSSGGAGVRTGYIFSEGNYGWLDYDPASSAGVRLSALNNIQFGINSNADYGVATFAEAMRITSTGNVGIGTSSPTTLFDVSIGTARGITIGANSGGTARTDATTKLARITVPHYTNAELPFSVISGISTSTENVVEIGTNTSSLNASSRISFYTGSTLTGGTLATERMRIDSSGNVTIKAPTASGGGVLNLENTTTAVNGTDWGSVNFVSNDSSAGASGIRASIVGTSTSFNGDGNLVFSTAPSSGANAERMRLDSSGNLLIGGTTAGTASAGNLVLVNGTAPTGNVTNGITLYAEDVSASSELKVRDEAGNVTTLSPHNFELIPEGPSEDMAWSYYSERDGKRINVDMLKAIRLLEQITGEKLVHMA